MSPDIQDLLDHAQRCRRLARIAEGADARNRLKKMAAQFEEAAARLGEAGAKPNPR